MIVVLAILLAFQFGDAKFERISELLDKVDFSVNPCQNFSAFVCTNETREMLDSNRVDVRQLFYETLEKNKVGFEVEKQIFGRVYGKCMEILDVYENTSKNIYNMSQFIQNKQDDFEIRTGILRSFYKDREVHELTTSDIIGVSAILKNSFDVDFLVKVSVEKVHKPDRSLDIFLRPIPSNYYDKPPPNKSFLYDIPQNSMEQLRRTESLFNETFQKNKQKEWSYLGVYEGFSRYENFPFWSYFKQLVPDVWPDSWKYIFDTHINVENPNLLNKQFDMDEINEYWLKDVHNHLNAVYNIELITFYDNMVNKMSRASNISDICAEYALDFIPDLTQQFIVKSVFSEEKERSEISSRLEKLIRKVKVETKNLINRLGSLNEETRIRLVERLDQTSPYFNGLANNYDSQNKWFKERIDQLGLDLIGDLKGSFEELNRAKLNYNINLTLNDKGNEDHFVRLAIDMFKLDDNFTVDGLISLLNGSLSDELFYGIAGPKIAAALWEHVVDSENPIKINAECFGQNDKFVPSTNEIASKIVYSAYSSSDKFRPDQLFSILIQLGECSNGKDAVKLIELSSSFSCPANSTHKTCDLLELKERDFVPDPLWKLRIPKPIKSEQSPVLDRLVQSIESRIDVNASPCDDFFNFACSNNNFDTFSKTDLNNQKLTEEMLQYDSTRTDPKPVKYMKKLYRKCKQQGAYDDKPFNLHEFNTFMGLFQNHFNDMGYFWNPNTTLDAKNFIEIYFQALALIQREFGAISFVELDAEKLSDRLYLFFNYKSNQFNLNRDREERIKHWNEFSNHWNKFSNQSDDELERILDSIDKFRMKLHSYQPEETDEMIQLIQTRFDKHLRKFAQTLFGKKLPKNAEVVMNAKFFLFLKTGKFEQSAALYTIFEDLLFHVLKFDAFDSDDCITLVLESSPASNAKLLIDSRYPTRTQQEKFLDQIGAYIQAIKFAFRGMINQVNWMNQTSKEFIFEKLDKMKHQTAFSPYLTDRDVMNEASRLNKFSEKHPIKYEYHDNKLMQMRETLFNENLIFTGKNSHEIGAFYWQNTMFIPIAILNEPIFDLEYPSSALFGQAGMVIAHEMVHAFDDANIKVDANGKPHDSPLIDDEAIREFGHISDCLEEQYKQMCQTNEEGIKQCIDSSRTLGENLADNAGIRVAFRAYRNWASIHGSDKRLNGYLVNQMTDDQIFFTRYAQIWCSEQDFTEGFANNYDDTHSPRRARVNAVLANFPSFRDAFNCPAGGRYGQKDHCQVWTDEIKPNLVDAFADDQN